MTDNQNNSNSNKSNISDENKNTLNNSNDNIISTTKISSNKNEMNNQLGNLKLFFLNKDIKDIKNEKNKYTETEYKKIVEEILKNEQGENYLEGKTKILDKVILQHSNINKISEIKELKSLKLTIDKNFGMLNDIGYYLPNLIELNLEGSEISSILDIGISYENLIKLNVSSGIVCFKKLEELNASNNMIRDLIDLEMCEQLKNLNLSNNNIEEEDNLYFLNSCQKLEIINLSGNPIANTIKSNPQLKDILNKSIQIILD